MDEANNIRYKFVINVIGFLVETHSIVNCVL